jgi:hypothetical protein
MAHDGTWRRGTGDFVCFFGGSLTAGGGTIRDSPACMLVPQNVGRGALATTVEACQDAGKSCHPLSSHRTGAHHLHRCGQSQLDSKLRIGLHAVENSCHSGGCRIHARQSYWVTDQRSTPNELSIMVCVRAVAKI